MRNSSSQDDGPESWGDQVSEPNLPEKQAADDNGTDRRTFLSLASSVAMGGGLIAGYGTLAYMAGKFLYPSRPQQAVWIYAGKVEDFADGAVVGLETPSGRRVLVRRAGEEQFVAMSTTCPHLGCQVHWEEQNNRFFCPCHNGVFDVEGNAVAGPPAEAGQSLFQFPVRIESGLVYIEVPVDPLTQV